MPESLSARWRSLQTRTKVLLASLAALLLATAAVVFMLNSDYIVSAEGTPFDAADNPGRSYALVGILIFLDAVMPIFPGETTLNAAATLAAQGVLELLPIIVAGAIGAILGDSALFWIARRASSRVEGQLTKAKQNKQVAMAFDLLDSSAGVLIIGGRYLPGMRFVVNATMGLSDIPYRRFLPWSMISGIVWSTYTSVLAYEIGKALVGYPLASFVISGLVTTVAIAVIFLTVRRNRRRVSHAVEPEEST